MTRDALQAPATWPRVTPTFTTAERERARQRLLFHAHRLDHPWLAALANRAHARLLRGGATR